MYAIAFHVVYFKQMKDICRWHFSCKTSVNEKIDLNFMITLNNRMLKIWDHSFLQNDKICPSTCLTKDIVYTPILLGCGYNVRLQSPEY